MSPETVILDQTEVTTRAAAAREVLEAEVASEAPTVVTPTWEVKANPHPLEGEYGEQTS